MKKLIFAIWSLTLAISFIAAATQQVYASDAVSVTIDGQAQTFEVPPQIVDGRTMLPIRGIAEALGMTVTYDPSTHTASLTKNGLTIVHRIGTASLTVNGTLYSFDTPSVVIQGRTLVPARMLAEAVGAEVAWNPETRTAAIITAGRVAGLPVAPTPADVPSPVGFQDIVAFYSNLNTNNIQFDVRISTPFIDEIGVYIRDGYINPIADPPFYVSVAEVLSLPARHDVLTANPTTSSQNGFTVYTVRLDGPILRDGHGFDWDMETNQMVERQQSFDTVEIRYYVDAGGDLASVTMVFETVHGLMMTVFLVIS